MGFNSTFKGLSEFITGTECRMYVWCRSSKRLLCSTSPYTRGLLSAWSPLWKP